MSFVRLPTNDAARFVLRSDRTVDMMLNTFSDDKA